MFASFFLIFDLTSYHADLFMLLSTTPFANLLGCLFAPDPKRY